MSRFLKTLVVIPYSMRRNLAVFLLSVIAALMPAVVKADVIYDNGAIKGTEAYAIGLDYYLCDSFTLSANSTLTGAQLGLWVISQDQSNQPGTVDWAIYTVDWDAYEVTGVYGSGTASLNNTWVMSTTATMYMDIYSSTFSFDSPIELTAGTYWLYLTNGETLIANPGYDGLYWDVTYGSSDARWLAGGVVPSNSFQLYGSSSPVPEPTTMLLLGSGLLGLAGFRKKNNKKDI